MSKAKPAPETSASPAQLAAFEAQKRSSVGQLLIKCARLLNEQAIARVRNQPGLERLRTSHMNLFPHIDFRGVRLTELARRVGISKQAVAQLVDELEAMGAVQRVPDPDDGRAKMIRFCAVDGVPVLTKGMAVLREFEGELAQVLGDPAMHELHNTLIAMEAHLLGAPEPGSGERAGPDDPNEHE